VLEWGARAKVIEPEDLVERVREELEGALALYGDSKGDSKRDSKGDGKAGGKRARKPAKK
jgi:hypothetical protein